jgi:hypothetical protein
MFAGTRVRYGGASTSLKATPTVLAAIASLAGSLTSFADSPPAFAARPMCLAESLPRPARTPTGLVASLQNFSESLTGFAESHLHLPAMAGFPGLPTRSCESPASL